jgi:hypothetical protein
MTLLIPAANIACAFSANPALTAAASEIRQGDRLAPIGANGSGKGRPLPDDVGRPEAAPRHAQRRARHAGRMARARAALRSRPNCQ